ncbi:hypothetical protein GJ744_005963 [Endocarpon pusillum]|uniref:Fungal N-terminal domain-containing protein n=1 Tax=Endocarpon pusillum TaxID=364733 RepID=A0A8H7ABV5_9EURO|nr:hypothetical protein GJ744_005963 [Endocarpon pusillum]
MTNSCECLYTTLKLISEAPKDLQHHITALQALQSTFVGIAALEKDARIAALITPEFKARLHACMIDLHAMERLAKSFHTQFEEGRTRRTWARIRWSSPDQRQKLKSQLSRIESYYTNFSLDLLLLNIQLSLPKHKHPSAQQKHIHPPDAPVQPSIRPLDRNFSSQSPYGYCSEHVSLRSSILGYIENNLFQFLLWLGPIAVQRRRPSLDYDAYESGNGYGIALAMASNCYHPFRLELAIYLMRNRNGPSLSYSIRWGLFWPRIIPWDAEIYDVVLRGDMDSMKREFSTGHSGPFDTLPDGGTLLHLAASQDRIGMVKLLLQEGARVNAMNNFGETPLHLAIALSNDYNISRVLVESGGDLHNRNADGKTPLHTFPSQVSEQILRCHGCLVDFSTRDHRGMSLLHYLAWSSKTSKETFRTYHERSGIDLRTVDVEGRSMLHLAAQRGNIPVIEYLLQGAKDFNINHRDSRGRTVSHYGVESKRAHDTLTTLISYGADIWARDCHGHLTLHHAAKLGNLPAVKALLAFGMVDELRVVDSFGNTPQKIAAHHQAHAVLTLLEQLESRREDLVGRVDWSAAEADSVIGKSLPNLAQKHYDALRIKPRQDHRQINRSFQASSQILERQNCRLSGLDVSFSVINCLALAVGIWILFVFLPR